jgi:hypothetical protein
MGTTLTGKRIKDTYDGLIKVTDNEPLSASTVKRLNDGLGNPCPLYVSQTSIEVDNGTFKIGGSLLDGDGDAGTSGQILSSTGSGVNWINNASLTTFYDISKHGFNVNAVGEHYIGFTGGALITPNYSSYIIPIYNGTLESLILLPSATTIGNRLYFYNGATLIGTVATFNFTANTPVVKTFATNSFSAGDKLSVRLHTDSATSNDIQVSMSWNYSTPI